MTSGTPALLPYTRENLGPSSAAFKEKMMMSRKDRVAMEKSSLRLVKVNREGGQSKLPKGRSICDSSDDILMTKMASYSSSKHVPFSEVLTLLGLTTDAPPEDAQVLSNEDLKYVFAVLSARTRQAPFPAALAVTVEELQKHRPNLSKMFPSHKEKETLPKATITAALTKVLPSDMHESIQPLVNFLFYNCRNNVRLCDLDVAFAPPTNSSDNQDEAEAENEEEAAALEEFNRMAAAIKDAEDLAKASVDEEEIAKVISFLDPSEDGEVDMKELESAFRIARRDQSNEAIDLDAQAKEMETLKKQLEEANKVEEEKSDFSDADIELVMNFMDPNRDGITTDEFENGFRDARRARATAVAEKKGRECLTSLLEKIKEVHPDFESPTDWFNLCNTNPGAPGSPVEVTSMELRVGLKRLGGFSTQSIDALLKYMDPDGDCDLTIPEFEAAIAKLSKPSESESKAAEAGAVIVRLEVHMDEANIRMIDLFRMMDKDGEGSIEPDEMKAGLKKLALPSGVERAKKKIAKEKLIKKINKKMAEKTKHLAMNKRLKEAEESGAAKVLRELEASMVRKGQRMIDLFREMDKSGDGQISRNELFEGLRSMAGPTSHQKAMMRKAVEEQEKRMAEMQAKQLKDEEIKAKVLACEESGAASVLGRLYEFITEGEQEKKIQDIFREYDSSGEGSLSHGELAMALDLLDMELTDEEVAALIAFLDGNGDGDVDLGELDEAMKGFLRIRRTNSSFGKKSEPRMSEEDIEALASSVGEVTGFELEERFVEANRAALDALGKSGADERMLNSSLKQSEWLNASRLSRAPTGRLPSLEDRLSEDQKLQLEAARLRLKKERKIAGEAHFKYWLKKKGVDGKKRLKQIINAELEEVDLPPLNLLNGEQMSNIVDFASVLVEVEKRVVGEVEKKEEAKEVGGLAGVLFAAAEEEEEEEKANVKEGEETAKEEKNPESGPASLTHDQVRAVFVCFKLEEATGEVVKREAERLLKVSGKHGSAKAAIGHLWRQKGGQLLKDLEDSLRFASDLLPIDEFRAILMSKLAMTQQYGSLQAFKEAKAAHEKQEKLRKKQEGEEAWKLWNDRKGREMKAAKRAKKKELRELLEKQKTEFDEMMKEKKSRREEQRKKYQSGLGGGRDGEGSIVSVRSKLTRRSVATNASTMTSSVALSLVEASISPYSMDPGKTYGKKHRLMKEKLKKLKVGKKELPRHMMDQAEAFRKNVLGPIPKHFSPIVGQVVGGDLFDEASVAASSISGDSLSLLEDQKMTWGGTGGAGRKGGGGRPPRSVKAGSGRPEKAGKGGRGGGVLGGRGVGERKKEEGGEEKKEEGGGEEEEDYGDDFEDFPNVPGTDGESQMVSFDISEAFPAEEEVGEKMDFFNEEAVAELPMEVYGDDFEDYEGGDGGGERQPLIEAVPPPMGHFSRPSTSGERPVSRSSSTDGSSRRGRREVQ
ncbi:hypothetical protein TrCOL_g2778 [Triparma columacea]|uniref:EF-hand domain-containing protein n=1 Tax=Triparma columacea TaxID=722753 RepID=A0A9W7GI48_9STRA|nr:hypothetical protein TrCOL_g2778 [Triparma columacea]